MIRYVLPLISILPACWHKPVKLDIRDGEVRLNRIKVEDNEFHWHTNVVARAHRFSFVLKGQDLLEGLRPTVSTSGLREFRSFHRIGHICVRTVAQAHSGEDHADFWVYVTYGHTGDSRPLYVREPLRIDVTGGGSVDLDAPPSAGMRIAHGQGLPIKHFRWDCTTGMQTKTAVFQWLKADASSAVPPYRTQVPAKPWWIRDTDMACVSLAMAETKSYQPFEQSIYTPAFPAMTGGQQQFGAFQVLPELSSDGYRLGSWRDQLYQEGCRPAHFLHPDGSRVTEDDYPETVLYSCGWIHERSRGSYWIKHTYPSSPWRDKGAATPGGTTWRFWDAQHWSLNALCQAYHVYGDPGLGMLIGDLAEGWLWSNPVTNKGTTHHHCASSARARGRVLEAGCSLAHVLEGDAKQRVTDRVEALLDIQLSEYRRCLAANESPLVSRKDGLAVWEHGLWVKGLFAAAVLLPHRSQEIHPLACVVADFVLEGFKPYAGKLYVPYVIRPNGSWSSTPSKQLSEWCLPAVQLLDRYERGRLTAIQGSKATRILDQFAAQSPPAKLGWSPRWKWYLW